MVALPASAQENFLTMSRHFPRRQNVGFEKEGSSKHSVFPPFRLEKFDIMFLFSKSNGQESQRMHSLSLKSNCHEERLY